MTVVTARSLGSMLVTVLLTDTRVEDGNMGTYMRVRVEVDATKALRR